MYLMYSNCLIEKDLYRIFKEYCMGLGRIREEVLRQLLLEYLGETGIISKEEVARLLSDEYMKEIVMQRTIQRRAWKGRNPELRNKYTIRRRPYR